jgi:hypothetical protein
MQKIQITRSNMSNNKINRIPRLKVGSEVAEHNATFQTIFTGASSRNGEEWGECAEGQRETELRCNVLQLRLGIFTRAISPDITQTRLSNVN